MKVVLPALFHGDEVKISCTTDVSLVKVVPIKTSVNNKVAENLMSNWDVIEFSKCHFVMI